MSYFDPSPEQPPTYCADCRGKLVTRWRGVAGHRLRQGYHAIVLPYFVCLKCKVAVRVMYLPVGRVLRGSHRTALRDGEKLAAAKTADRVRRYGR